MLSSGVVHQAQRRHSPTGTKHPPRRLRQGADLRVAISGLPDRLSVDAEGDVVQEDAAVHFAHVDQALHPISERVKGPGHVLPVHTEVERKMVARPAWDADEGQSMRRGDCCYVRERPVAARHPERICALGHDLQDACPQVAPGVEHHCFDSVLACPLDDPVAGRRAATRPGVDEQHGPPRRLGRAPATTHQCREPGRGMRWTVHVSAAIVTAFLRVLPGDPTPGGCRGLRPKQSRFSWVSPWLWPVRTPFARTGRAQDPRRTTRVGTITLISPSRRAAFTDLGDDSPAWLKRSPRGSPW